MMEEKETAHSYKNAATLEVSLLARTPDAKKIAFTAIRRCYSAQDGQCIFENDFKRYEGRPSKDGGPDSERLLRLVITSGHLSTLEHVSFTFAIDNLSRAALAQLTRHRIGFSYSVQSQRYVRHNSSGKNGPFGAIIPDLTYLPSDETYEAHRIIYEECAEAQRRYDKLLELGVRPEDARSVIPQAATTNLILSCNLRALLDFCGKRDAAKGAQDEIAELAKKMMELVVEAEPWIGRITIKG